VSGLSARIALVPYRDGRATFWETQAAFVAWRGIGSDRKRWSRDDEDAWRCYYIATEEYWRQRQEVARSVAYRSEKKAAEYRMLLDDVGFVMSRYWIRNRVSTFMSRMDDLSTPLTEPDFDPILAQNVAEWRASGFSL